MINMPNKNNIADTYKKLIDAFTLISDKFEKSLPKFSQDEFLNLFGAKFQEQLTDAGKKLITSVLEQNILSPMPNNISERFQKDYEDTLEALIKDFPENFDLDASVKKAQGELQKKLTLTKNQLLADLTQELNDKRHNFTAEDKTKLETVISEYVDKNYRELSHHLEKFKDLPAVYTKYQLHLELAETQKGNKGRVNFNSDLAFEHLLSEPKPEPTVGFRVDRENLAKQLLSDLASGKNIEIDVIVPNRSAICRKIIDIGLQHRSPDLALFCLLILALARWIHSDEKRVVQAIKQIIEENQLFDLDPSKITLRMTTPTANGNDKVIRKKGPLSPEHINELQSLVEENKNKLREHHHLQIQTNKKSGSTTPTESGYNSEEEEIPYPRPRF